MPCNALTCATPYRACAHASSDPFPVSEDSYHIVNGDLTSDGIFDTADALFLVGWAEIPNDKCDSQADRCNNLG